MEVKNCSLQMSTLEILSPKYKYIEHMSSLKFKFEKKYILYLKLESYKNVFKEKHLFYRTLKLKDQQQNELMPFIVSDALSYLPSAHFILIFTQSDQDNKIKFGTVLQALQHYVVPIIVKDGMQQPFLPFSNIIEWEKVVIFISDSRYVS